MWKRGGKVVSAMGRKITIKEAEIRTASVEIRTLTVSGKQVTLAVFRQLIEESVLTEDMQFAGLPWGTVNYHWGDCRELDYRSKHTHVVWQKGAELRRDTFRKSDSLEMLRRKYLRARAVLVPVYALVGEPIEYKRVSDSEGTFHGPLFGKVTLQSLNTWLDSSLASHPGRSVLNYMQANEASKGIYRASVEQIVQRVLTELGVSQKDMRAAADDVFGIYGTLLNRYEQLTDEWQKRETEIYDLPQLFIAV
jgi:hypothetical protein